MWGGMLVYVTYSEVPTISLSFWLSCFLDSKTHHVSCRNKWIRLKWNVNNVKRELWKSLLERKICNLSKTILKRNRVEIKLNEKKDFLTCHSEFATLLYEWYKLIKKQMCEWELKNWWRQFSNIEIWEPYHTLYDDVKDFNSNKIKLIIWN